MIDLLIILVVAVVLSFIRPAGRRILGVMGLGFGLLSQLAVGGGPDNFGLVFPFLGFNLAAAAMLGEAIATIVHVVRRGVGDDPHRNA